MPAEIKEVNFKLTTAPWIEQDDELDVPVHNSDTPTTLYSQK